MSQWCLMEQRGGVIASWCLRRRRRVSSPRDVSGEGEECHRLVMALTSRRGDTSGRESLNEVKSEEEDTAGRDLGSRPARTDDETMIRHAMILVDRRMYPGSMYPHSTPGVHLLYRTPGTPTPRGDESLLGSWDTDITRR